MEYNFLRRCQQDENIVRKITQSLFISVCWNMSTLQIKSLGSDSPSREYNSKRDHSPITSKQT